MMAALEAALSAQSSKYATVSQQLRLELKEAVAKASQVKTNHSMEPASSPAGVLPPAACVHQQPSDASSPSVCTRRTARPSTCCCSSVACAISHCGLLLPTRLRLVVQAQSAKAAALEASLREQSDTLAELAAAVSELPTKGALLDVRPACAVLLRSGLPCDACSSCAAVKHMRMHSGWSWLEALQFRAHAVGLLTALALSGAAACVASHRLL